MLLQVQTCPIKRFLRMLLSQNMGTLKIDGCPFVFFLPFEKGTFAEKHGLLCPPFAQRVSCGADASREMERNLSGLEFHFLTPGGHPRSSPEQIKFRVLC